MSAQAAPVVSQRSPTSEDASPRGSHRQLGDAARFPPSRPPVPPGVRHRPVCLRQGEWRLASLLTRLLLLGAVVTNGIAGWMNSGDRADVGEFRVAEEAADDVR